MFDYIKRFERVSAYKGVGYKLTLSDDELFFIRLLDKKFLVYEFTDSWNLIFSSLKSLDECVIYILNYCKFLLPEDMRL